MKKILLTLILFILVGCCDGPNKTRNGDRYYNIKICAIGGNADTCVNYKAKDFNPSGADLMFTTIDDHVYRYNHAGWAWAIEIR